MQDLHAESLYSLFAPLCFRLATFHRPCGRSVCGWAQSVLLAVPACMLSFTIDRFLKNDIAMERGVTDNVYCIAFKVLVIIKLSQLGVSMYLQDSRLFLWNRGNVVASKSRYFCTWPHRIYDCICTVTMYPTLFVNAT
ncbi:uncharacterized protein PHALS_15032 [Plasmopara halstedii]|uniref:Uncharacterized protein n=1 Tax=Plasmopara halstedii TaxID=4781 RepID=A0A0N7L3Y3_PLAHL|nr:uncharacterized protein PHALS_15032 [Plasmopara halstedii]CEG37155.1 hypothetical protein PHALS_15032 [Plasmopara halstedii]|eukprot:XP_024573524.1 hypothetical protein PHALS_15032 [Plasmopara halstedii]